MKALLCESHGLPETLVWREVPTPEPGPGEIRVRVKAAGVNFPDGLIIQNLYQFKPALPFSPGSELSGVVDAVGEGVTDLAPGDRILAMNPYGAFAEEVVTGANRAMRIPDGMPFDVAAAFMMVYGTSYHALEQRGHLAPGETLLVLGAAGGVGLAAVELGKVMGARVIAAASSDEKCALAKAHGADETINYATSDLREAIKALTGGKGVDVIYDPVGGNLAEPAFRSIRPEGRFLVVGFASGQIPSLPLNLALLKHAAIVGVFWGDFVERDPAAHRRNMAQLYEWYGQGKLKPHISARFPLAEGGAAIRWVMDRHALGKVVLLAE